MLLEVVRLEELDALLGNPLCELILSIVELVCLEQKIYNCAGAVSISFAKRRLCALKNSFLFHVSAPEVLIGKIPVATLVCCVFAERMCTVKDFNVGLWKVKDALFPAGEQQVTLRHEIADHRLIHLHNLDVMFILDHAHQACLQDLCQTSEHFRGPFPYRVWQYIESLVLTRIDTFVRGACAFHIPAFWIATVTAPADVRF